MVDSYEMDIEKIQHILFSALIDSEFKYISEDDDKRLCALEEKISNLTELDESYKKQFKDAVQYVMQCTASNSFEIGLKVGLSVLQNLLTAKLPEIHVTHHEPNRTERRCEQIQQHSDVDNIFIGYIERVCPFLDCEQKAVIQNGIEKILSDNTKKHHSIF